ncbi:Na+/H+ antiporter NhaA [Agrococcus jejuensis]|uniref:Na(+)/H(+) antiporter NhaA n=1 Tax=Agrococcus jejuensis TaxID=399736 RepID=A0A1G8D372_9MICO|nr:Na+/H+ antiporter NhaA [Agrococcus jejuensis]SDH52205.1 Na+/H+ antiporter NhaA [Agrococcus jejuensis]
MARGAGWAQAVIDRLRTESGSALLLVAVSLVALAWANSPWSQAYVDLWHTHAAVTIGDFAIDLSLHHWVNDGLMVIFFFLIGLEVREELAVGSLRQRSRALVPLVAGLVGVALPAIIYLAIAGREAPAGWGVVIGTDTAFLLGALALVGPRMSSQLRVFLLTLTVVDDFLAVAIIGVFYTDDVQLMPLGIALAALVILYLLGKARQWRSSPYVAVIVVLWAATLLSGIHPSLAGMAAGLLVPAAATERSDVLAAKYLFRDYWQSPDAGVARLVQRGLARSISVNQRLHEVLRGPVSLVIVPIFALANAGVDLRGGVLGEALTSPVTWGVVAGLTLGKFLGIGLGAWGAVRAGLGRLPDGVGPGSVAGGAALSGIGFTMSLLIISLAFDGPTADAATVGVLIALVLSWALGWLTFRVARTRLGETEADLPSTLEPEVDPDRDHVRGPEDAVLTVVEYLDFECPFCARATGMWTDLKQHFDGRIRYVVRHLPLDDVHPHARGAAIAAEAAARQDRFWEMHDVLFANQSALEAADLRRYAEQIGLDLDRYDEDILDEALAKRVRKHAQSAHESGARGTPTFFLNGTRHRGPHDARTMIAALEAWEPTVERRRS